jgi:hypothetical protein
MPIDQRKTSNTNSNHKEDDNPYRTIQGTEQQFPILPTTQFGPHPYLVATGMMAVTYMEVHHTPSWASLGAIVLFVAPSLWMMVRTVKY